jgi:hypothetical protein
MYANGFTVNDGPLRLYSEPENKEFMEQLQNGKKPKELAAQYKGQIDIAVANKTYLKCSLCSDEEYRPPHEKDEGEGGEKDGDEDEEETKKDAAKPAFTGPALAVGKAQSVALATKEVPPPKVQSRTIGRLTPAKSERN